MFNMFHVTTVDMVDTVSPTLVVDRTVEAALSIVGLLAAIIAAYYAGRTGNGFPLMVLSIGLCLFVLFVTSDS